MMCPPYGIENVFTLGSNFNCCNAPGKSISIVLPSLGLRSAPQESTDVFQGCGNNVSTSKICLYWVAILILNLNPSFIVPTPFTKGGGGGGGSGRPPSYLKKCCPHEREIL